MNEITKETLRRLRESYPEGCRVRLINMEDPYTKLLPGEMGTVVHVDCVGTIHVDWDNGSGLGVAYGMDRCERID